MLAPFAEQDLLAALVSTVVVLAPLAYVVLSNRRKSLGQTADSPTPDYSSFNTSNLRVTKLLVHPIKSCKGTSVREAKYTLHGLENDRKWCIIRADNHVVVTARQVSKLVLVCPRIFADPLAPEGGHLQVSFPEDSGCEPFQVPLNPNEDTFRKWTSVNVELWGQTDIEGYICEANGDRSPSTILSEYVGYPVHLVVKGPRVRDGYPLLLMSEESVGAVQERVRDMVGMQGVSKKWSEEELQIERFRPNIVFKGAGAPFIEDVITELAISSDKGTAVGAIKLVSKCTRCLLPNVDPGSGVRDSAVPYKAMMKFRRGLDPARAGAPCLGCNGILTGEGVVRVGDWVHVRKMGFV